MLVRQHSTLAKFQKVAELGAFSFFFFSTTVLTLLFPRLFITTHIFELVSMGSWRSSRLRLPTILFGGFVTVSRYAVLLHTNKDLLKSGETCGTICSANKAKKKKKKSPHGEAKSSNLPVALEGVVLFYIE